MTGDGAVGVADGPIDCLTRKMRAKSCTYVAWRCSQSSQQEFKSNHLITTPTTSQQQRRQAISAGIAQNPLVLQMLARQERLRQVGGASNQHTGSKPVYAGLCVGV
jgi:hypothetical protein